MEKRNNDGGILDEILQRIRTDAQDHMEEAAIHERIDCIYKTAQILKDLEIDNEKIISLLQKYWDLRRSEAETFLE